MCDTNVGTKICSNCKQKFPKTTEFFHKKITKQKNKNGSIAVYQSLRHTCKSCYNIKHKREKKPVNTTCKKCGVTYENVDESFPKSYKRVDGSVLYGRICKNCKKLAREYKPQTDKEKEQLREWRTKNKDRVRELGRKYREENKDAILKREKERRDKNPDRHRMHNKKWYDKNKPINLASSRKYHAKNRDIVNDRGIIKSIKYKYQLEYVPEDVKEAVLTLANIKRQLKKVNN